jgi:hypothetical protein
MPFVNTSFTDAVNSMIDTTKQIIKSPILLFTDKPPTPVDYFNRDTFKSTVDEESGLEYDNLGTDSPAKFNLIKDALIYGLDRIEIRFDNEESGMFADPITGDAYVLPNTFVPHVGDFFIIKYIQEKVLFKVTELQTDTLDTGANYYKISYIIDRTGQKYIDELYNCNLNDTYRFVTSTVGTEFKTIVREAEYDFMEKLENDAATLKEYYKELFFNNSTQTFTFQADNGQYIYDPYLIEFLIRTKIMAGTEKYIYIDHAMYVGKTFGIEYDKSFFRALELRDKDKADKCIAMGVGHLVEDTISLLTSRLEDYYYVDYNIQNYAPFTTKIETVSNDLIDHIVDCTYYDTESADGYKNIIIKYFQSQYVDDNLLKESDLSLLDHIETIPTKDLFYAIPILIFVLEIKVKEILTTDNNTYL